MSVCTVSDALTYIYNGAGTEQHIKLVDLISLLVKFAAASVNISLRINSGTSVS